MPSDHGIAADRMEGFSRMAPLWAAWIASGRPNELTIGGGTVKAALTFRQGLIAGTDPESKEYWGKIGDRDQRIVESADIALALWLLRDQVWTTLDAAQKHDVVAWLEQVNGKDVPDNNWHLFVVLVDAVLKDLSGTDHHTEMQKHYARLKSFYRGDGWFSDGPGDVFDYYNAWEIHYHLFWLDRVAPDWDPSFISSTRREFVKSYRYLFTSAGFPIMGRSVCYRMAAPVPLVLSQFDSEHVDGGEARRVMDATWQYFLRHNGAREGNITQGYCGSDARVLDNYSGPASCLWGLRSLIAALYLPKDAAFWTAKQEKLQVERGDFSVTIKSSGWKIVGHQQTGTVEVEMPKGRATAPLEPYSPAAQELAVKTGKPSRPDNHAAKYERAEYESADPFCGCN